MIRCFCLFDITTSGNEQFYQLQRRNWNTLLQTLSIRSSVILHTQPKKIWRSVENLELGSVFSGHHNVWIFDFELANMDAVALADDPLYHLKQDTDYIPMITGLEETVQFPQKYMRHNCAEQNISFLYPFDTDK
jgi:hypothetical protein